LLAQCNSAANDAGPPDGTVAQSFVDYHNAIQPGVQPGHQPRQESRVRRSGFHHGPGQTAHVLLSIEEYRRITGKRRSIVEALSMPGLADIELDPPRSGELARGADLTEDKLAELLSRED